MAWVLAAGDGGAFQKTGPFVSVIGIQESTLEVAPSLTEVPGPQRLPLDVKAPESG